MAWTNESKNSTTWGRENQSNVTQVGTPIGLLLALTYAGGQLQFSWSTESKNSASWSNQSKS